MDKIEFSVVGKGFKFIVHEKLEDFGYHGIPISNNDVQLEFNNYDIVMAYEPSRTDVNGVLIIRYEDKLTQDISEGDEYEKTEVIVNILDIDSDGDIPSGISNILDNAKVELKKPTEEVPYLKELGFE